MVNQNNIKMYTDNLQLSALFGNHYHKIQMSSNFYKLEIPCSTVFHAHQQHYICPAVNALYLKEQVVAMWLCISSSICIYIFLKEKLFNKFNGNSLQLPGDGRCDSPGSSAKYCSYSLTEVNSYKILHVETG